MTDLIYLNGDFVPLGEAKVSIMDRGLLFGDGVYEVIPAYGGRMFRLEQHLSRLDRSLAGIRMQNPLGHADWERALTGLSAQLPGQDQNLYLQVTRGAYGDRAHAIPEHIDATYFAYTRPARERDPAIAADGVSVVTAKDIRWDRCDLKTITLLANVLAVQEAKDRGADEAVLIRDGQVLEGASSNLFMVVDGTILTPPKGPKLLPGVTRDLVLELAEQNGLPWHEADIPAEQLSSADELWLTSSTREVMPVTRLDDVPVGDGRPGPVWRRMDELFGHYKDMLRQAARDQEGRGSAD